MNIRIIADKWVVDYAVDKIFIGVESLVLSAEFDFVVVSIKDKEGCQRAVEVEGFGFAGLGGDGERG